MVTQTYNQPGIEKTLNLGSGSNPYAALDRFGRMIDLRWKKGSTDLVGFEYDYDRVGNRLFERNTVSTGSNPDVDSLFGFDQLNRMTDFDSGLLNTGGTAIASPESSHTLELDETGNISRYALASGSTTVLDQTRTHNAVNEITNITETVGPAWATPAFDDAGNMTAVPQPNDLTDTYDATWDAWNRLVKLADGANTVAVYQYDAANRRIIVQSFNAGVLDETRHIYYTSQSQAIEERVDSSSDADRQFVWNLGYVDDLILRDRDTNASGTMDERLYSLPDLRFSVMALANAAGTILERFTYDALGASSTLTPGFASRTSSGYDWEFRYTGRREDLDTELMFFRARYYHPNLGRFVSRVPLGFVDGMSQYRAYFVPGAVDPSGGFSVLPNDTHDTVGPDGRPPYPVRKPSRPGPISWPTPTNTWPNDNDIEGEKPKCGCRFPDGAHIMRPTSPTTGQRPPDAGGWDGVCTPGEEVWVKYRGVCKPVKGLKCKEACELSSCWMYVSYKCFRKKKKRRDKYPEIKTEWKQGSKKRVGTKCSL